MSLLKRALLGLAALTLCAGQAWAVPAFARQTGMSCAQCHTEFPELTPFGRQFKLNGYVLGAKDKVTDTVPNADGKDEDAQTRLEIGTGVPLGAMIQAEVHWIRNDASKNLTLTTNAGSDGQGYASLPTQVSLFFAGEITPKVGAFMQLTYDPNGGGVGIDNTDIRYADHWGVGSHDLLLGATINNNITAQDVYNSTPAWGFPFAEPDNAPGPTVATQIEGAMAQNVAGLGVYVDWDSWLYAELSGYRTNPQAGYTGEYIQGWAPYWRVAAELDRGNHAWEVGAYGVTLPLLPGNLDLGTSPANTPADIYTDVAFDTQYQYIGEDNIFTLLGSYTIENQALNYSSNPNHTLSGGGTGALSSNTYDQLLDLHMTASYLYKRAWGAAISYFQLTGNSDPVLYNNMDLYQNVPNSNGFIYELSYRPWLNTRLSLDYAAYGQVDGTGVDYDGAGRSAADNNTLTAMAWFAY
jgi:hypothetical protein